MIPIGNLWNIYQLYAAGCFRSCFISVSLCVVKSKLQLRSRNQNNSIPSPVKQRMEWQPICTEYAAGKFLLQKWELLKSFTTYNYATASIGHEPCRLMSSSFILTKGQTKFESICQEIQVGQVLFGDLMTICFVVYFIHSESSNRWVPSQAPRHTRKSRWDFLKPSCAGESPVQTWVGTGHFTNLSFNKTRTESWWLKTDGYRNSTKGAIWIYVIQILWLVVFIQPLWKICSSKWVHLPQFSGWQ